MISSLLVLISCFNFLFLCMNIFLNLNFTSKATETSFLVVFTDVRLVVPSHCCSEVSWSPDRTFPNLHVQGTPSHKNHTFNITNIRVLQLRNSYRGRRGDKSYTWCGYKITGLNFFPFPCKVGKSELCVVSAYLLPSIHG